MIEIKDKERKAREEVRKRKENEKKEEISTEEHQARINMLKDLGLVK